VTLVEVRPADRAPIAVRPVTVAVAPRRRGSEAGDAPTDADLAAIASELDHAPAEDIVAWAVTTFGRRLSIAASMTDAVLIDLAARVAPGIEVIFLDTQYHFQETLATVEAVRDRYPIRLRVVWPERRPDDLWRTDPDACCRARKVLPLERALSGRSAWLSGVRAADSPSRTSVRVLQRDRRGLVKVNPLVRWTDEEVAAYVAEHDVPVNPLVAQGFPSIGCWPCTRAVAPGEDARAGRWDGTAKTECGLHL
jgi:phosphoadenosine phosphosulfate reductase